VTYSEDWMRPDYIPPSPANSAAGHSDPPLPAEAQQTDPADGLTGMMMPGQGGS
jgi:phospholipid/cholesterol/gamma-HCH transport system substrate-binding protein